MNRILRFIGLTVIGVGAAVAFTAVPASAVPATAVPANAVPATAVPANAVQPLDIYQCYLFPYDSAADAYCSGTAPSSFRVWITCTGGEFHWGPWRTAGAGYVSRAYCTVNHFLVDDGVQTYG